MGRLRPPLTLTRQFTVGRAASNAVRIAYESRIEYEEAHRLAGRVAKIERERLMLLAAVRRAATIFASLRNDEGKQLP